MKTYLVTGGAGFIGSHFITDTLTQTDDIRVINVDNLTYAGDLSHLDAIAGHPRYCFHKEDICNRKEVSALFARYKPEIVINFAAETHVDTSINRPEIFVRTNIMGTQVLLETAVQYPPRRFIQISTDEVYGALGKEGHFREYSALNPSSPYSASKAGADCMVLAYARTYGLMVNITRCTNNYGPRQHPEKLIPMVIKHCLQNRKIPVYGDGSNIREWLWVGDHCRAIQAVIRRGTSGEIYNIGSGSEYSNIQLVQMIVTETRDQLSHTDNLRKLPDEGLITFVKDRKGHDFRYALNTDKIRQELGWEAMMPIQEGIKATVKWYLEHEQSFKDQ